MDRSSKARLELTEAWGLAERDNDYEDNDDNNDKVAVDLEKGQGLSVVARNKTPAAHDALLKQVEDSARKKKSSNKQTISSTAAELHAWRNDDDETAEEMDVNPIKGKTKSKYKRVVSLTDAAALQSRVERKSKNARKGNEEE